MLQTFLLFQMSKAYRYLLNLSYIGTPFRGVQKQLKTGDDNMTIQGNIEIALRSVNPLNEIQAVPSSRTDTGVHALHTTMHVDLHCLNGEPYSTRHITHKLNKHFMNDNIPIRILSTYQVPDDFHCRYALSRTYLYRLVVMDCDLNTLACHVPIEDMNRAYYKSSTKFDFECFQSACKLFTGLHDFRTFMGKGPLKPDKITRRVITRFEATKTDNKLYSPFSMPDPWIKHVHPYQCIDIEVESSGFLFRQVRRMLAAVIAAAEGTVTEAGIRRMLTVPAHHSWEPRLKTVPANGLYLARVTYPPTVIRTFRAW